MVVDPIKGFPGANNPRRPPIDAVFIKEGTGELFSFARCDREKDYKTAWKEFDKRVTCNCENFTIP